MPYKFKFDLSKVSQAFVKDLVKDAYDAGVHKRAGENVRYIAEKLKLSELTGLNIADATTLVEDMVDIHARNIAGQEKFRKTKRRALLLPHCARKYMDSRCKATFDASIPSYSCAHCSPDCLINQSDKIGTKRGYDVFILPGGSCIPELLKKRGYDGVVGVACTQELKEGGEYLESKGLPYQTVFLVKNGCANTRFNIKNLKKIL